MPRRENDAASKRRMSKDSSAKSPAHGSLAKLKENVHVSKTEPETIILSGSAKLPEEAVGNDACKRLTIEIEIKLVDSTIVDFSCTGIPFLEEKILRNALLGKRVEMAIENAVLQVTERFRTATKKALIAALQDVYRRFQNER